MNFKHLTLVFLCSLAALSCQREILSPDAPAVNSKITGGGSDDIDGTSVLFYAEADTPAGLDSIAASLEAKAVRNLFDMSSGDIALKRSHGLHRWYEIFFEEGTSLQEKAEKLASFSDVRSVQFNTRLYKCNVGPARPYVPSVQTKSIAPTKFNDPYSADQWSYKNSGDKSWAPTAREGADINVSQAWTLCAGDPRVVVAVIDEAVQTDHPDLRANIWTRESDGVHGWNFTNNSSRLDWSSDNNSGHGTHVAGTVAAVNNNGIGVSGIAGGSGKNDGVKIMSCQIFDGFNGGTSDVIANAFKYAADNGACIAQCSFGANSGDYQSDDKYYEASSAEVLAMRYFIEKSNCPALDGGLIIVAAGNDGESLSAYPAALRECISVCSIGIDGLPVYYTNFGPGCNISAPGGEPYTGGQERDECQVLSTMPTDKIEDYYYEEDDENFENPIPSGEYLPTDYGWMSGTSMACPHASGVAALGLSYALKKGYHYTNEEFKSLFMTSVYGIDAHITSADSKQTIVDVGFWGPIYGPMKLSKFKNNMGTGVPDVWRLYMNMDGTPTLLASTGEAQKIDVSGYFGTSSENLTYLSVELLDDAMDVLGLSEKPMMRFGKLQIHPTKAGCARLKIKAIAGGNKVATGSQMGGTEVSRVVSIISKPGLSSNGGWL